MAAEPSDKQPIHEPDEQPLPDTDPVEEYPPMSWYDRREALAAVGLTVVCLVIILLILLVLHLMGKATP